MQKGPTQEIIKRIEAIEGIDAFNATKKRYAIEMRSFRWLSRHWHVNERTVRRILIHYGIQIRHGGEAVATQWIGNATRREKAGKKLAEINHRLAQEGKHVRQGKNKSNSELIRKIAERLKTTSAFHRPDVMTRSIAASIATRREHPERMSALRNPLSKAEKIIFDYLTSKGFEFKTRFLLDIYVVDFFIPSLSLVIDCQGRSRFPLSFERHKAITKDGNCVAYCINEFIYKGIFTNLDNYITSVEIARFNPAVRCAEAVIFGACGLSPFGIDSNKILINRFGMRSNYYSEVTTTTDDDIAFND